MTRIVTTTYRYKRPPRKRKPVALEAPAVVTAKSSRRPSWGGKTAAEDRGRSPPAITTGRRAQSSTPRDAARVISPPHHSASPANDDQKSAIVTVKRKSQFRDVPDLTPEELHRRGDAADAMWRGLVDQATTKDGKSAAASVGSSSPAPKPAIVVTARKRSDGPHLPMELSLSRKPVERDGDDYKRLKAAMARRLRGESPTSGGAKTPCPHRAPRCAPATSACCSCRHQADADLYALVESGRGDVPLTRLKFRCSNCGSDRTDFVVTSRDNPQPW